MGTTSLSLSGVTGASSPHLDCPWRVGAELWHAQHTSGPGICRPGLAAHIPCPHPGAHGCSRPPRLVQLDVARINGAPAGGGFN